MKRSQLTEGNGSLLQYKWQVGVMSELAPEGYVGVSPKCLLGFNKVTI